MGLLVSARFSDILPSQSTPIFGGYHGDSQRTEKVREWEAQLDEMVEKLYES
jgi:hypothetical protein